MLLKLEIGSSSLELAGGSASCLVIIMFLQALIVVLLFHPNLPILPQRFFLLRCIDLGRIDTIKTCLVLLTFWINIETLPMENVVPPFHHRMPLLFPLLSHLS